MSRTLTVPLRNYDGSMESEDVLLFTPDPVFEEPASESDVMHDVNMLCRPGAMLEVIAAYLIPLAFRLLCMAAFGRRSK